MNMKKIPIIGAIPPLKISNFMPCDNIILESLQSGIIEACGWMHISLS